MNEKAPINNQGEQLSAQEEIRQLLGLSGRSEESSRSKNTPKISLSVLSKIPNSKVLVKFNNKEYNFSVILQVGQEEIQKELVESAKSLEKTGNDYLQFVQMFEKNRDLLGANDQDLDILNKIPSMSNEELLNFLNENQQEQNNKCKLHEGLMSILEKEALKDRGFENLEDLKNKINEQAAEEKQNNKEIVIDDRNQENEESDQINQNELEKIEELVGKIEDLKTYLNDNDLIEKESDESNEKKDKRESVLFDLFGISEKKDNLERFSKKDIESLEEFTEDGDGEKKEKIENKIKELKEKNERIEQYVKQFSSSEEKKENKTEKSYLETFVKKQNELKERNEKMIKACEKIKEIFKIKKSINFSKLKEN